LKFWQAFEDQTSKQGAILKTPSIFDSGSTW
jgi:hypothetical protein